MSSSLDRSDSDFELTNNGEWFGLSRPKGKII
jgi:hypothetical protein